MIINLTNDGLGQIRVFNSENEKVKEMLLSELNKDSQILLQEFVTNNSAQEISVPELAFLYRVEISNSLDMVSSKEITGIKSKEKVNLVSSLLRVLDEVINFN